MFKTPARTQKEAREKQIRADYKKLVQKGAMKTMAVQSIMEKYGIRARSTVYNINKRQATT